MKKTGVCTKCSGRRVIKVFVVPDSSDFSGSSADSVDDRVGGSHAPRMILPMRNGRVSGETEAYVCAECGWFEEYLADPQNVAWDNVDGQWVAKNTAPYRG